MEERLADFLINSYYGILRIFFLAWLVIAWINLDAFRKILKDLNRKTWVILFLIVLSGLALRLTVIPHTPHVYFDEFDHINVAENMSIHGKTAMTFKGGYNAYEAGWLQAWPPGYHTILALIFSIFSGSQAVAFNVSAVIGAISIALIFFVSYLLFHDQEIALYSAFLFNLIPVHLKYSGASEPGITSLSFLLLTLFALLVYVKKREAKTLAWLISTAVLTVYMRPENVILLLWIPFAVLIYDPFPNSAREKTAAPLFFFLGSMLLFLIPFFIQMYLSIRALPRIGWDESLASRWVYLKMHIADNLLFWFSRFHPVTFTVMAVYGLMYLIKKNIRLFILLLSWFVIFLVTYSQYSKADFMYIFDSDRFALNLYIPLILMAALGLFEFSGLFRKNKIILSVILLLMVLDIFAPLKDGLERTFQREVYQEYLFIKRSAPLIPDNVYVVTYDPPAVISTIRKMAMMPEIFLTMEPKPQTIILFKDHWWREFSKDSAAFEKRLNETPGFNLRKGKTLASQPPFSFIELKKGN